MTPVLYNAIAHLTDGRVFALIAPHLSAMPFIVYTPVAQEYVMGMNGPHDLKRTRVQVDVWARAFEQASSIQSHVMDLLVRSLPGLCNVHVNTNEFDPQSQAFRVSADYTYYE